MGYLTNATGYRLGWRHLWCDVFYSENIYYPEYIHALYRVRFYLLYFFSKSKYYKRGYFFSHYSITQLFKKLSVSLYWHDGRWEQDFSDYFFFWYQRIQFMNRERGDYRIHPMRFHGVRILPFILYSLKSPKTTWLDRRKLSDLDYQNLFTSRGFRSKWGFLMKQIRGSGLSKKFMQDLYIPLPKYKISYFSKKDKKVVQKSAICYKVFRWNVRKVQFPFLSYNKRLYQFYNLPFLQIFLEAIKESDMSYFVRFIKSFFFKTIINIDRLFYQLKVIVTFLVFIILLVRINGNKGMVGRTFFSNWRNLRSDHSLVVRRFFFVWCFSSNFSGPMFSYYSLYLNLLFRYMVFWKVDFKCFLITNDEVTARFLSRYIGIKLQYNHTIRTLMRTLRLEFKRLIYFNKDGGSLWGSYLVKWTIFFKQKSRFRLKLLKKILSLSVYYYRYLLLYFLNKFNYFFCLDMVLLYIWFYKSYTLDKSKLLGFSSYYFKVRSKLNQFYGFFFFNFRFYFSSFEYLNNSFISIINPMSDSSVNYNFFKNILHFLFSDFIYNKSLFYLNNIYFVSNCIALRSACWHVGRYFKFRFWKENYGVLKEAMGFNNLRSRKYLDHLPGSYLLGYKIQFKGRFTRRQRSKSVFFTRGRVPLTSTMSFIDFAYYVVPLSNSAVSIRVWFHRPSLHTNLYYAILS